MEEQTENDMAPSPSNSYRIGGVWKHMIRIMIGILNAIHLESRSLTHEVLTKYLAEVSSINNARPLVLVLTDSDNPLVLSSSTLRNQTTRARY